MRGVPQRRKSCLSARGSMTQTWLRSPSSARHAPRTSGSTGPPPPARRTCPRRQWHFACRWPSGPTPPATSPWARARGALPLARRPLRCRRGGATVHGTGSSRRRSTPSGGSVAAAKVPPPLRQGARHEPQTEPVPQKQPTQCGPRAQTAELHGQHRHGTTLGGVPPETMRLTPASPTAGGSRIGMRQGSLSRPAQLHRPPAALAQLRMAS
mmetsp:Transcript_2803/g.6997  ORF Transcript_2803/g.6997 Transcript_2803/m.6997 type:complete len:211 (-) Transcript_2803:8-640(-)